VEVERALVGKLDAWLDFNERAGRSATFRFLPAALFLADFFAIAVPPLP
jgi:hypothetical protein